tara:strand:+ start:908 stop:1474 length:567 start_codon:yes stop_codon:yes gene_type:complete
MEPISTTLAAVALVKAGLSHANDIKDIAGGLDKLFHAASEKPKPKKKPEPKSRTAQILRMRMGETKEEAYSEDSDSISSVANDILEKQKQDAVIASLAREINLKFPQPQGNPTTWDLILTEQKKRVAAKAELKKKAKEKARIKQEEDDKYWDHVIAVLRNIGILLLAAAFCVGAGYIIVLNKCDTAVC